MTIVSIALFVLVALVMVFLVWQMSALRMELGERLSQANQALQETHNTVGSRLDNTANLFGVVQKHLGELIASNKQIFDMSKEMKSFQDLLRAPKLRGQIGETLLENILAQVFPKKEFYAFQYAFKNGEKVDAIIRLNDGIVPIDAKFPLENFQRIVATTDEVQRESYRKEFIRDVKKHIEDIAVKYIRPDEGTFDFALMYIPAENVYYEIIIKEDFIDFSVAKHVIPVSPNTFYAYLQAITLGLKGMQVEKNAKAILEQLARLDGDMKKIREDFRLLGTHLVGAQVKYEEVNKKLDRFSNKLLVNQQEKQLEEGGA